MKSRYVDLYLSIDTVIHDICKIHFCKWSNPAPTNTNFKVYLFILRDLGETAMHIAISEKQHSHLPDSHWGVPDNRPTAGIIRSDETGLHSNLRHHSFRASGSYCNRFCITQITSASKNKWVLIIIVILDLFQKIYQHTTTRPTLNNYQSINK